MHFIAGFCVCCMPKAALKIWRQFGTNDRLLISAVLSHVNYRGGGQGLAMMIDF